MNSENEPETIGWNCWLRTLYATKGALLLLTFIGITESQSAVMLPQLSKADSFIHVTQDEETWIASLGLTMAPIASLLVGPFIDQFGRKRGLQYFYFNMGLGFGLMAFAKSVYHIYIGRIICGVVTGLEVCSIVYIAEVSTKTQRSDLFTAVPAMFSGGVALSIAIGSYLPWTLASLLYSLVCFIFFILEFFIPESPPWLFKNGEEKACIQSFERLGRNQAQIRLELDALKLSTKEDEETIDLQTLLKPTVWKPFIIMCAFFLLQSASGLNVVIYYTVDFVESLGTSYDPLVVSMIMSFARFLSTATIGVFLRSKTGRKLTVAISAGGMTVAAITTGVYEYVFHNVAVSERTFQWVPVAFMILYMASGVSGMLCLPYVMPGEVYPLKVRGTMVGVTYFVGFSIMFVFVKEYYVILEMLQIYGFLFAIGIISFIAVLFAVFILPETNHKTLFEIEQGFLPKKERVNEFNLPNGSNPADEDGPK